MNREWAIIISVLLMCLAGIACFAIKYYKPVVFTDPTAQRIYAIRKLTVTKSQQAAIEKLRVDDDIVIDCLYYRLLRDTVFLNKIRRRDE